MIPATAAFEGQVFPTSPDNRYLTEITGIYPPGPCDKLDGCAIGVKIPVGFKGTAQIDVGRKARPGERFQNTTSWDAPSRKDALDYEEADSVPDTLLVHGGFLTEPGRTSVMVHSSPMPQRFIDKRNKANGCPSS